MVEDVLSRHLGDAGWVETLRVDGELTVGRVAGRVDRRWRGRPIRGLSDDGRRLLRGGASLDSEGLLGLLIGRPRSRQPAIEAMRQLPPPRSQPEQWVVDEAGRVFAGTVAPPPDDLAEVIRAGRGQLGPFHVIARPLLEWPGARPSGRWILDARPAERAPSSGLVLTTMQQRVAGYAAAGATVAEIASSIGRSEETVKTHLRAAYRRLDVTNRVELARALA